MDHRTLARLPLMNGSLSRLVRQSPTKATSGTTLNDWPVPPLAQMAGLCPQAQVHIAPLPPAYADPALLQCVFENPLSNALKFSKKREDPVVEVGVEESAEGETIFFVSDNGAGFDMGVTTHLFDPFIRLHDSAAYPGTGVGLAIVKNVIDRHHGRVWAQAAPGQGAKFSFTLGKQHGEPEIQEATSPAEP